MICGIGVDLVNIPRMERALSRWGGRLVERLFTPREAGFCYARARPAHAFALRFAAKEALSKALGTGLKQGVRWRDMEVLHEPSGKPTMRVRGRTSGILGERGVLKVHLSLSDEREYGIAMVVLEGEEQGGDIHVERQ